MVWERVKYTQIEINRAGKLLANDEGSEEEKVKSTAILDNWRAVHSYPMHIFQMRLKKRAQKIDPNALTAQRLKRIPAIISKLKRSYDGRSPSMKLHQMQDIGGCRAILSNVTLARKLCNEEYIKGDLKHKRVIYKDYITEPKEDGYRSIHLVYGYKSDKNKKEFDGLLTEIQIRSKLQHLWATAVETAGFFTRQAIKSNEGSPEWTEFFRLVASAFAKLEDCPPVPNTPEDEKQLFFQIKQTERKTEAIKKMKGWTNAIRIFRQAVRTAPKSLKFFLLQLDIVGERLDITAYNKKEEQLAIEDYSRAEKRNAGNKEFDVVLVGADTSADLEKAYPNYFVDTKEFLEHLKKLISKV